MPLLLLIGWHCEMRLFSEDIVHKLGNKWKKDNLGAHSVRIFNQWWFRSILLPWDVSPVHDEPGRKTAQGTTPAKKVEVYTFQLKFTLCLFVYNISSLFTILLLCLLYFFSVYYTSSLFIKLTLCLRYSLLVYNISSLFIIFQLS